MPRPTSAKTVQRFIGKCQYYRKFIPNFSLIAAPLFKAQTSRRDFAWTDACDLAWTRPREAPISDAILVYPDYTRDFLLGCDGSGEGLGAALLQADDDGEKVAAYASRSLLEHAKTWTATELEAAALIWALESLRPYIDGVNVTIRTDHAPLEYIRSKIDRCKRLERWALRLQEFRFSIQPRPGAQQKHVDARSRALISVEADQQPIVLDEFSERVVLLVRSWDERIVAWPTRGDQDLPERRGRDNTSCMTVQGLAEKAHAQRQGLRCRRGAARLVGHVQEADAPTRDESEDDGCQVLLTDGEESDGADAALVVPGNDTDRAMLGTGEGGVALPNAFPKADRIPMQAQDPACLRYRSLVNKPRAQWPPHQAAAPIHFLYVAGVLCVQVDYVGPPGICTSGENTGRTSRRRRTPPFLGRPRIVLPADLRQRAIHAHHLSYYGGHFGLAKTFARLALRYWWPRQRANVRAFLARCTFCMPDTQCARPWRSLSLPIGAPFEFAATDIFSPLKPTALGQTHILALIDH